MVIKTCSPQTAGVRILSDLIPFGVPAEDEPYSAQSALQGSRLVVPGIRLSARCATERTPGFLFCPVICPRSTIGARPAAAGCGGTRDA